MALSFLKTVDFFFVQTAYLSIGKESPLKINCYTLFFPFANQYNRETKATHLIKPEPIFVVPNLLIHRAVKSIVSKKKREREAER